MPRTCFRCDTDLQRPLTQHANYIIGPDTTAEATRERHYAMVHTETTHEEVARVTEALPDDANTEGLDAEMAHPDAPASVTVADGTILSDQDGVAVETADTADLDFSVPTDEFIHVRVDSPNVVQDDAEVAATYTLTATEGVTKTGLVCPDCYDADADDLIWGVAE
jgi:hypothetical protein